MFDFLFDKERKWFIHDVFLVCPTTEILYGFQQISLRDLEIFPTRTQLCVAEGHSTWEGLCQLLIKTFNIAPKLVQDYYMVAWVDIKKLTWSEEDGSYYKIEHRIINDRTPATIIASYIYNTDVDFTFKLTKKRRVGIMDTSSVEVSAMFVMPDAPQVADDDSFPWSPTQSAAAVVDRTASPQLIEFQ